MLKFFLSTFIANQVFSKGPRTDLQLGLLSPGAGLTARSLNLLHRDVLHPLSLLLLCGCTLLHLLNLHLLHWLHLLNLLHRGLTHRDGELETARLNLDTKCSVTVLSSFSHTKI